MMLPNSPKSGQTHQSQSKLDAAFVSHSSSNSIFTTIPPERVGLRGEYDYNGLSKRVRLKLEQQFKSEQIETLQVDQRGAVVLLIGEVNSQRLLRELITASMSVDGAVGVEVNGVTIYESLHFCQQRNDLEAFSSYAF
jgi:osmotically-inducible protein OsmY